MIDTIVLNIKEADYKITKPERFTPNTNAIYSSSGYNKCVQNPSTSDYVTGNYKPRLTLQCRKRNGIYEVSLKIEFSIPKLVYGNNFVELKTSDYDTVIDILYAKLLDMGIFLHNKKTLSDAQVFAVHYSKNIILEDHVTSSMVINKLSKANMSMRYDSCDTNFINNGHALHFRNNSMDLIFYDKIKDLEKARISPKRAIEQDKYYQPDLFLKETKTIKPEVFRMEIRLSRRLIKDIFKRLGFKDDYRLKAIFDDHISKRILQHYWNTVISTLPLELEKDQDLLYMFRQFMFNLKASKALSALGYTVLRTHFDSARQIRSIFGKKLSNRYCRSLEQDILSVLPFKQSGILQNITKQLEIFEPIGMNFKDVIL